MSRYVDVEQIKKFDFRMRELDDDTIREIVKYRAYDATRFRIKWGRYIASWYNAGGEKIYWPDRIKDPDDLAGYPERTKFGRWLKKECHLTDREIVDIIDFATSGKLELECSAKKFISENENHKGL